MRCCYKAKSFICDLLNHLFSELGLFTLHNCCVLCSLDFLKSQLESNSRLPILEFSVYHCWEVTNISKLPPMAVTETRDQYTALPLVGVLVTWYGGKNNIINYILKMKKSINNMSKFSGFSWDIVVFRLVAYFFNMICLSLWFVYKI